jgi:hypothetical protein
MNKRRALVLMLLTLSGGALADDFVGQASIVDGDTLEIHARMESRPPVRMTPTRIPKAFVQAAFIQNSAGCWRSRSVWASPLRGPGCRLR